jgi:excisionase family DNA binding protein
VARTVEHAYEQELGEVEREQRKLALLEHARPQPLTDQERRALARLARDQPRLWEAATTSDRDRKELLRTIVREVVVTLRRPDGYAAVEIFWEGGARSQLRLPVGPGAPGIRTSEETVALVRRLAEHHHDREIAATLNKQGRLTSTGLPFTQARVRNLRQRAGISAAPPPDPDSELVTIQQAAERLGVSGATVRRWLKDGLLPGEQVSPQAPWRIRLSDDVRRRFVPEVPDGFLPLDEAARRLGVARQTVLHQVQRGERRARSRSRRAAGEGFASRFPAKRLDCLHTTEHKEAV